MFRAMPGDIAAPYVGPKATQQQRADWLNRHGYDRPMVLNIHRRLVITDHTKGDDPFAARDRAGAPADALALFGQKGQVAKDQGQPQQKLLGRYVWRLTKDTPIAKLTGNRFLVTMATVTKEAKEPLPTAKASETAKREKPTPIIDFHLADGGTLEVDLGGVKTCEDLIERINNHPNNKGRVEAGITDWAAASLLNSQFVDHLVKSVTFQARSLRTNEKLTEIIGQRAPISLSLTVPAMAMGWIAALVISCFVAYFRGTALDKMGVFLSVLGMCIPFLAFMIYGQWAMFEVAPSHAYGLFHRSNIYLPVLIMVIAGLGGSVRFYRTVILDEVGRDYVRTARAKGAPLTTVLFKHVLKNCMLPILTNLIMAIPFLIMGSLLVETYFGISGLGDLTLTSINNRDEPIINAMVFLTAAIYTAGVTVTDIGYAVFDPRIRLR
jgi:peptide/nickel transport system permease protein